MSTRFAIVIASVALGLTATPQPASGQESFASARQLYASAEYKEALSMLDGLLKASPSPQDRQNIDLYRTFCLFALGGVPQATTVVEEMIRRDPLYRPNLDDMPPRLRALFSDAKRRLLPVIIQQRYLAAKAAFDRNDYRPASEGFSQVLLSLADPDIGEAASQPPLADLKVLASGFNDLTIRSLKPPASATQTAASASPSSTPSPAAPPAKPVPAPATAPQAPRTSVIYSKDSPGVTQPVIVRQDLPSFPGRLTAGRRGIVDVVIDVTGAVESATMVESIDPVYNRLVLTAAKTWTYRPARLGGQPVKFLKRIEISIAAGATPVF